jgi:PAS domain S-box-containing protein
MSTVLEWIFGATYRRHVDCRVTERTRELDLECGRIRSALRGSSMHVFFQDRELRYRLAIGPQGHDGSNLLGRTDDQVLPSTECDAVIAAKQRVLATGTPEDCEVFYVTPEGRAAYALHIEPSYGPDNIIEGVTSSALDISRIRSLESEQRRLSEEVKITLQRYELALRESKVLVFTQDSNLRYTSISSPAAGLAVADIIGRTDEAIFAGEGRDAIIALKNSALRSGSPQDSEIGIASNEGGTRWYDFHIEPLRDLTGTITGLIGAAIDVTKRKEDEAHQRLLMRELTHRSKNLLAVIQAMARQTARHATSTEQFLEQFDARLQALAVSHDMLIEEGWHGASLRELAVMLLEGGAGTDESQTTIEGPTVLLKPEAAQALGLALHELAANAKKFGALSVPKGHLALTWRRVAQPQGDAVELRWIERGGPQVASHIHRRFGSVVIERNLAQTTGGKVDLVFPAEGVQCAILIPPAHLVGFADR